MSYIEDLSAITTPSLTDLLYIYQNGDDFKVTNQQLLDLIKTNTVIPLTQAQYDALTPAEKNNGSIYIITDGTITADDVEYSSGVSVGDKLDAIGTMYSATWSAGSSSASNTRLTNSCTLGEKGVYLISVIVPNSNASIAFGLRVEGWGVVQKYGQQNSLGAMTFPFEAVYDNLQIYIDSQQSGAVTFSNIERGGLYAVKIK